MLTKLLLLCLAGLSCVESVRPPLKPPPPPPPPPPKNPPTPPPRPWSTFAENVIYQPDSKNSVLYPRQVELSDGNLLATASFAGDKTPYFPVFQSADGGATWSWISNLTDQVNGLGMSAQPALAELPFAVGDFPVGTVLASGNSWGSRSTNIDIYASKDKGHTWKFSVTWREAVGRILPMEIHAFGSHLSSTERGNSRFFNHTIGVFYSDQRDPLHGQKLAHQESADLKSWGPVIDDVAYLNYTARPGMTIISYIPPLEKWILVHEFPGGDSWSGVGYPVYYRIANSPFDFRFAYGIPIMVDGVQPNASPYVVWSPSGGDNGTIVVSDADHSGVFTNQAGGQPDQWELHDTPQAPAYSRSLHVFEKYPDHLMILGAGVFDATVNLPLYLSVVSVEDTLKKPPGR